MLWSLPAEVAEVLIEFGVHVVPHELTDLGVSTVQIKTHR